MPLLMLEGRCSKTWIPLSSPTRSTGSSHDRVARARVRGFLAVRAVGRPAQALAGTRRRRRSPPRQPPQIPGYEIVAFIDGGGQGDVYQARHVRLDRPVALKVLRASGEGDGSQLARFHREGRLSARLDHPNIVRI